MVSNTKKFSKNLLMWHYKRGLFKWSRKNSAYAWEDDWELAEDAIVALLISRGCPSGFDGCSNRHSTTPESMGMFGFHWTRLTVSNAPRSCAFQLQHCASCSSTVLLQTLLRLVEMSASLVQSQGQGGDAGNSPLHVGANLSVASS